MPQPKSSPAEVSMPTFATLEEWTRSQVQELMQSVLEEEVTHVLGRARYQRQALLDAPRGHRNGYGKLRKLSLTSGTIEVKRPRVRGLDERFESAILPLFARRTQEVGQLLPELYLYGLSQGDFELALRGLLGEGAPLSPSSIARLRDKWIVEYNAWRTRRLDHRELVYAWADGIYVKAGLEKQKAALLVVIGAMSDGRKEILTIVPGYRESTESWTDVLRDLRDRGLTAPVLLAADGHLGIWAGLAEIWPHTGEQRCWNHRILNVLNKLPKTVQAEAKKRRDQFAKRFRGQYPDAAALLERDWDRMVTFYDYPEAHWQHLRTTNVIESPFAPVRLRTDAAKRYKKVANATALIWRVLMVAEKRFRKLNAPHLMTDVYAGERYEDGAPVEHRKKIAA